MTKCFCVGSILQFVIATALLSTLLVNVFQVIGNKHKCREYQDDILSELHKDGIRFPHFFEENEENERMKMDHVPRDMNMKPGSMHKLDESMRRMAHERMERREKHKGELKHSRERCAIADYDDREQIRQCIQWGVLSLNTLLTFVIGILGSGLHCSSVGHRKLGLKIASIVFFILQLLYLLPSGFLSLVHTIDMMDHGFGGHYYKGRLINGFIMAGLLFLLWLVNLIHSFAACCCTPTEDEETVKIVRMKKNTSDDRLKLVDNVVFGERVFDNDGEIA